MKATRNIVLAFSLAVSTVLRAEPQVSEVTFSQPNQSSRRAEITYRLEGEPAIVTIDIQTNGVSIGAANLTHFSGDANRVIGTGAGHVVHWYPDLAWPDHKVDSATAVVTAWATNAPPNYMVVDLTDGSLTYYTAAESLPTADLRTTCTVQAAWCSARFPRVASHGAWVRRLTSWDVPKTRLRT